MALMQFGETPGEITGPALGFGYDVARAAPGEVAPAIKACGGFPGAWLPATPPGGQRKPPRVHARSRGRARCGGHKDRPPRGKAGRAFCWRKRESGRNVQAIADWGGRFVDVSASVPASVHGMKAFRQKADPALLGRFESIPANPGHAVAERAPRASVEAAAGRQPGGRLTDEEIARNRRMPSKGFVVERGDAFVKSCGIVNAMR